METNAVATVRISAQTAIGKFSKDCVIFGPISLCFAD